MMRFSVVLIFILAAGPLQAQSFKGRIIDILTKQAIAGATVKSHSSTITDGSGTFTLFNVRPGDTIKVIHMNYKPYMFTFNRLHPGALPGPYPEFALVPDSIELHEVAVKATRNYKADSLNNRNEFESAFKYKPTAVKDIFVLRSPEEYMARHVDVHLGNNPYSASSFVKINMLKAIGLLSKNKTAPSKLQHTLLRGEGDKYLDQLFSAKHVTEITRLQGDSLQTFMLLYKPSLKTARQMTTYEILAYIRNKHAEFMKATRDTVASGKPAGKAP